MTTKSDSQKNLKYFLAFFGALLIIDFILPDRTYAYLDPGVNSTFNRVLVAIIVFFRKIFDFLIKK